MPDSKGASWLRYRSIQREGDDERRAMAEKTVHAAVATSPINTLHELAEPAWDSPILSFAAGNDTLFQTCINRCPANAISSSGHDKKRCFDYIKSVTAPYAKQILGAQEMPCERRNPVVQH